MIELTALAQRLASLMQEDSVHMSDSWGRLFDALRSADTENERMASDLTSRNSEIEDLRKRVEELDSRTVTVKLPAGTGWASDPYNHGRNDGISECAKELRAAGIKIIEGEEQ